MTSDKPTPPADLGALGTRHRLVALAAYNLRDEAVASAMTERGEHFVRQGKTLRELGAMAEKIAMALAEIDFVVPTAIALELFNEALDDELAYSVAAVVARNAVVVAMTAADGPSSAAH
jgi:hypothetical protein